MISIGELAKRTAVKVPTIRYYEEIGLLAAAARSDGNQRRYRDADVERLGFIRHARELGFPLDSIRELLDLAGHPDRPCQDADRIAREQLASVRSRIESLKRLENELQRIATACAANTAADCYVLRALNDHSLCRDDHAGPGQ